MSTTAEFRSAALDYEQACRWLNAAHAWDAAADAYPPGAGALREADVAKLRERAVLCRQGAAP